jgi:hypothetical protein
MKNQTLKFWLIFWTLSSIFLVGWFFFWNIKNRGLGETVSEIIGIFPIESTQKKQYQALAVLGGQLLAFDKQEKTLLVLFQNNLELRPGGGFIGAFAIVKLKGGKIISMETHDLSNFDANIPNTIAPPYPMRELGYVDSWKLRDSNFSPDFETNAKKALDFYYLGGGSEQFDGVVGITANMLTSVLKITGPIQVEGYPGTYKSEDAIISLEYQVEKAFEEQGISRDNRKSVMKDLSSEIEKKVLAFSISQKLQLAKVLIQDLNQKDIQLYFKNPTLQQTAQAVSWTGAIDQAWQQDFLMLVDANLGSFKSDYYIKRSFAYAVDLTGEIPQATLRLTYEHTAKQKDWMTRDYTSYLRVYVPTGAWLVSQQNFNNPKFGTEFGKKYFGSIIRVPIGTSRAIEIKYNLPASVKNEYNLKIQKQAGITAEPVSIQLKNTDGTTEEFSEVLD